MGDEGRRREGRRVRQAMPLLVIALIVVCPWHVSRALEDADIFRHAPGIWEIGGKGDLERWIVIHNLGEAAETGTFHIEVLGREKGSSAWSVLRLCPHMAVTLDALKKSVLRPLKTGTVYPEAFDDALAAWKRDAGKGIKVVCTTSILDCLEKRQ